MRFSGAVVAERIRMGEEVERLRGQVGVLRREVWFTRRRDVGAGISEMGSGVGDGANGNGITGGSHGTAELVPARRLSDTTTKQIVKL